MVNRVVSGARVRGYIVVSFPPLGGMSCGGRVGSNRNSTTASICTIEAISIAVRCTAIDGMLRGRRRCGTLGFGSIINDDDLLRRLTTVELVPIDRALPPPLSIRRGAMLRLGRSSGHCGVVLVEDGGQV